MANDSTARQNWVRFYKSAPDGYKPKALEAVLSNDGVKMLADVLQNLKLEKSVDLILDWQYDKAAATSPRSPDGNSARVDSLEDVP